MVLETPDLITAGFPCQGMSVAGKGGGFSDDRSALFFEFVRLARRLQPGWFLLENVPGFLSAPTGANGRDFTVALAALDELGYGVAWTSLDAQYFGLAQRRERVFLVGRLGAPCPPEILFEPPSVQGNTPPSREAGEKVAPSVTGGPPFSRTGNERVEADAIVPCLNSGGHKGGFRTEPGAHLVAGCLQERDAKGTDSDTKPGHLIVIQDARGMDKAQHGIGVSDKEVAYTLDRNACQGVLAFDTTQVTSKTNRSNPKPGDPCHTLAKGTHAPAIYQGNSVRRLTPRECERLQGFPDDWTLVDNMKDSARYRMLGNAVAVPVIQWMLKRLRNAGVKTIGECFSGIGGFALAAQRENLNVLWASEIDKQAITVYHHHFPDVQLLGDIRKLEIA